MSELSAVTTDSHVTAKSIYLPWVVCFSAALFFFFEFMQVNLFNAIAPSLMKAFSLSSTQVGQMSAQYFYANLLFLFPAGMILDRFSTRKVIIIALASSVLCTYIFALTTRVDVAFISRFVIGIGGSFCFISSIRLATRWFPPKRLALVIGLVVTLAMFGGMLAQTPMTLLTDFFGWRTMLFMDGTLGVLILFVILLYVRDNPPSTINNFGANHSLSGPAFFRALGQALRNTQNWAGGLYTSLLNLPILLLGAMWGSLYLEQIHGLTRIEASFVTSMIFIGMIVGSPVVGWFSDRIGSRRIPMLLCAILSFGTILCVMMHSNMHLYELMSLFFAIGFFSSGQIISYPLIAESNPHTLTGTAEGIAATLIMAGGLFQPIFGALMSWHWDRHIVNDLPLYSTHDFQLAMSIMPIAFMIALVIACCIRETHCKHIE